MKKLMIAATAALCATVGLCVESANIVGYQTKDVRKFLSQQVCTFDQIGAVDGALDIQKLVPVDDSGDYVGDGAVNIQFTGPLGVLTGSFAYYGADEYDDGFAAGWYNEDEDELAVYTFAAGEGFQVNAGSVCNFQYSGEVNMAETDVPFRKFLSAQGNIRPSSVDIQTIIPVDDGGEYIGDGAINIQFTGPLGVLTGSFAYYGADEYDDGYAAGWYDESTDELAEYSFGAGEGFLMLTGQACYLKFPAL